MGEHFEELLSQATNFLSSSLWRKTENVFLCTQSRGENVWKAYKSRVENVWKAVKSRYENVCSCWPYRQSDINNPTKQVTGRKVLFTEVSHSFLSRIWEPEVGGQRELKIDVRSESQIEQIYSNLSNLFPICLICTDLYDLTSSTVGSAR